MAKTYLNTVKYEIKAKFEIQGIVDKHDIIGAIFGQSEGLLGEDMDLKELQQSGKIGRIEVNSEIQMGKTVGTLIAPSSMDTVKTSMLAASIESVDKVGPYESKFEIEKIEDSRATKRTALAERAKQLLQKLTEEMPQSHELAQEIVGEKRAAGLVEFGKEKLPAGPEAEASEEIIVVEGRADVLNLLKSNVKNVIGMNGAKISQDIVDLSKSKRITVFVDGDRGGDMIARQLIQTANIEFVAKAPDGKEVEELVRKEILLSLSRKIPAAMFSFNREPENREFTPRPRRFERRPFGNTRGRRELGRPSGGRRPFRDNHRPRNNDYGPRMNFRENNFEQNNFDHGFEPKPVPRIEDIRSEASPEETQKFGPIMQQLQNSLKARFLDEQNNTIKEVSVRDMLKEMQETQNSKAVVFDGIVTKRLVDAAEQKNINYLVGVKKGRIENSEKVKVVTIC
ncbi:MAG: DNA primase DnaG [Candidatus ainarchaeum sp.]|nr:DNA primase DnaG [Candidatus ainarchaeum sp.]